LDGREFPKEGFVVNFVEAFFDVGVQHKLGFEPDEVEDRLNGVMR
jgi:hypothetical protein